MNGRKYKRIETALKPCPVCGEPMKFDINKRAGFITLDCINTDCPVMPFIPIARNSDRVKARTIKHFPTYWNILLRDGIKRGFYIHLRTDD